MGNLRAGQTLTAQGHDGFLGRDRGRAVQAVRLRRAVLQPGGSVGLEAGDPLAHRLGAHAHRLGRRLRAEPALGQPHKAFSNRGRQTRSGGCSSGRSGIAEAAQLQRPRFRPDG